MCSRGCFSLSYWSFVSWREEDENMVGLAAWADEACGRGGGGGQLYRHGLGYYVLSGTRN